MALTPWERPEALRGLRLVVGLGVAAYLARVAVTLSGDRLAAYPLMHPDSFDWLANGLRYTGVLLDVTWRAPMGPLVYAALFALRLEDVIPFLGLGVVLSTAAMLLTLGWRAAGMAAVWAAVLLAANHLVLGQALSVQTDVWSAGFGLAGILALVVALEEREPGFLYGAAAALTLGGLAQPATPFLAPACIAILLYDPDARRGVGLGRVRWVVGRREAWGALALAAAILLAPFVIRRLLVGVAWPESKVIHGGLVEPRLVLDLVGFYAWATVADWSIPVSLLAVVGAVAGLRQRGARRLTLGLLAAVAGNAAMFAVLYTAYRENRFVTYWTLPALLLAGLGLRSLRPPAAVAAFVVAAVASNLTVAHSGRPGTEPILVLWPTWAVEARYSSVTHDWAVVPLEERAKPFRRVLGPWLWFWRERFAAPDVDELWYSRVREALAATATAHVAPDQTLYLHHPADENPTHVYIMWDQLALYARRRTQAIVLDRDPTLGGHGAVVLLRRSELDRLRAGGVLAGPTTVLAERGAWVLVRLYAGTPASSRKMSSIERVSSQPG